jgi:hypothetical protein
MPHQKSSDYKETAVQYYLVEDKTQEELFINFSYKMGVLNEKRCKELVRYKLLNECPIALNFIMKATTETDTYDQYIFYELIRLSEFNNHIRIKYRSCYRIINKTNIDRNELKCLMDKHQLECYNFLKK